MYVQSDLFGDHSPPSFQTELTINTNVLVAEMHRNALTGQKGTDSQHHSASAAGHPPTAER